MTRAVVSVTPEDTASTAAQLLSRHNIGAVPVCADDGVLRGIVTDRDLVLRCLAAERDPETTSVREIMTTAPLSVSPGDDVRAAAHSMASEQIRRTPVTENGRVVGMLSLGDLARVRAYDMEASKALSEISSNVRRV
jgi:CBS domain-containing protein